MKKASDLSISLSPQAFHFIKPKAFARLDFHSTVRWLMSLVCRCLAGEVASNVLLLIMCLELLNAHITMFISVDYIRAMWMYGFFFPPFFFVAVCSIARH